MIECPGCGSNLIYDIARQKMYCKACGSVYVPENVDKQKDGTDGSEMEINQFICPQCAGEIYSTDDAATAFCSYCGASTMLSSRLRSERRPDYIIPFKVTKERCKEAYVEMMKKAIYAPSRLRNKKNVQEFRGIYIPYWLYDVEQKGPVQVTATENYVQANYNITDVYMVQTSIDNQYENIAMDASSLFPDDINNKIAPFDAIGMKPFSTGYLSGFYADLPDVDYQIYKDQIYEIAGIEAYEEMYARLAIGRKNFQIKDSQESLEQVFHSNIAEVKTGLFPVWFMSYKNGKRIAYAMVNGQSGKVVADIPMDSRKFLVGCLIGIVPIYFLLDLFVTIRPSVLLSLVALIGAFVVALHAHEMKKLAAIDSHEADQGLSARHSLNKRLEKERKQKGWQEENRDKYGDKAMEFMDEEPVVIKEKTAKSKRRKRLKGEKPTWKEGGKYAYIALQWIFILFLARNYTVADGLLSSDLWGIMSYVLAPIAMVIAGIVWVRELDNIRKIEHKTAVGGLWTLLGIAVATAIGLIHPVEDQIYYAGVLLVGITMVMTLLDVVLSYNQLATRPLPQFEYRGGDDRA